MCLAVLSGSADAIGVPPDNVERRRRGGKSCAFLELLEREEALLCGDLKIPFVQIAGPLSYSVGNEKGHCGFPPPPPQDH